MQDLQDPTVQSLTAPTDQATSDPFSVAPAPQVQQVFDQTQVQSDRPLAAMNAMMSQVTTLPDDPLNPTYPTSSAKESAPLNIEVAGEMPSGMQSVEQLRSPEISPEVEKYIEEVREEPSQFTHEVVLADQKMVMPANGYVAQPVIVLPMTAEEFQEAKKAPPDTARRWLAEFTEKIKKMFVGSVVFREEAILEEKTV